MCELFRYPELTVPGKENNTTSKKETNSKLQSRRKYHRKNYVATYQVVEQNFTKLY